MVRRLCSSTPSASAIIREYPATRRTCAPVSGSLASMASSNDSSAAAEKRSARRRILRSRTRPAPRAAPVTSKSGRITLGYWARTGERGKGRGERGKGELQRREWLRGKRVGDVSLPLSLFPQKKIPNHRRDDWGSRSAGDGLLSRALSGGVPSALQGLTAVFGMGTGVAPAL